MKLLIALAFALLPLIGFVALILWGPRSTWAVRFRDAASARKEAAAALAAERARVETAEQRLVEGEKALSKDITG